MQEGRRVQGSGNAIRYSGDIPREPAVAHDLEEKIDKDGVHADDGKELQAAAMVAEIDPPIAEGQDEQAIAQ